MRRGRFVLGILAMGLVVRLGHDPTARSCVAAIQSAGPRAGSMLPGVANPRSAGNLLTPKNYTIAPVGLSLDDPANEVSFRFTNQRDASLVEVFLFLMPVGNPQGMISIEVRQDDGTGLPGPLLGSDSQPAPANFQWVGFFPLPVPQLVRGTVYHIVVQHPSATKSHYVIPRTLTTYTSQRIPYQPTNMRDGTRNFFDARFGTLYREAGYGWGAPPDYPVFLLQYFDPVKGMVQGGQPYSRLNKNHDVYASIQVGERIVFDAERAIEASAIRLFVRLNSTAQGPPEDDLFLSIYEVLPGGQRQLLASCLAVSRNQIVQGPPQWHVVTLVPAVRFEAGKTYLLAFSSPGTSPTNAYRFEGIFGTESPPLDVSSDPNANYGGTSTCLSRSVDGGGVFTDQIKQDLAFEIR